MSVFMMSSSSPVGPEPPLFTISTTPVPLFMKLVFESLKGIDIQDMFCFFIVS